MTCEAKQQPITISYSEFRKNGKAEPGCIITNIKPDSLYTTQGWIETGKVADALNRGTSIEDTYPAKGYIDGKKLILGDGNTKALVAWERGRQIQLDVVGPLPAGVKYMSLKSLRIRYHDLFRAFEYG